MKDKTCSNHRCSHDECKGVDCDDYAYNHRRIKASNRLLPCDLTTDEIIAQGEKISIARSTISSAEEDFKAQKKAFDGLKSEQEGVIMRSCSLIDRKKEDREVACETVHDYTSGKVTTTRLDTYVVIDDRPLNDDELQQELDLHAKNEEGEDGPEASTDTTEVGPSGKPAGNVDPIECSICAECGEPFETEDTEECFCEKHRA